MPATALTIHCRRPYADGCPFGRTGPYELIEGAARFAIDPKHAHHAGIVDLHLAPRDDTGLVHCEADFRILRPADPSDGNRRLLFDVVNRGNATALTNFNLAESPLDPGDGFLMRRGYTIAACGWQGDLLSKTERVAQGFPPAPDLLRAHVPEAPSEAGQPHVGRIAVTFELAARAHTHPLAAGAQRPHPTIDLHDTEAVLLVRDHETAPARAVPRADWAFGRFERGRVVPDDSFICMPRGFDPGRIYSVVYTTRGADVVGLGLLIPRDFVAFLRYAPADQANPCAGAIDRALAFGRSQSGSFLRHLLYRGLTRDTLGRPVFDGVLSLVAGVGRTEINQRFGQPGAGPKHTLGRTFPFADTVQTDPETGQTDGLLATLADRAPADRTTKVFFINTSSEYWRGDAALIHTAPDGSRDLPVSDAVRIYHYAGTQHSPGDRLRHAYSDEADSSNPPPSLLPPNAVDYRPLLRAALVRLDHWASGEQPPPPSCHPRLDDGTAVGPERVAPVFLAIPNVTFPTHLHGAHRMDFGPRAEAGLLTRLPPVIGRPYPELIPAVDDDGNETAGIRAPEVAVPLATHTGWNVRHPGTGGPGRLLTLVGATIPFPPTRAEALATGDPRLAIDQRYASRQDYLDRVMRAAQALVHDGHLLEEDLDAVAARAAAHYDVLATR